MTECTIIVVIIAVERILVNNFSTLQHSGLFLNVTEVYFLFVRDSAITFERQIAQFGRSLVCLVQVHCCFRSESAIPSLVRYAHTGRRVRVRVCWPHELRATSYFPVA